MKNKPNFFKYSKVSIQYLCTLIFNIKHQINVQYYYNSALKCNNRQLHWTKIFNEKRWEFHFFTASRFINKKYIIFKTVILLPTSF